MPLPVPLRSARGAHVFSVAIRTQKIRHPRPISNTMPFAASVKMRSTWLLLASEPLNSATPSSHSSCAKANNQLNICTVSILTQKFGKCSSKNYYPILTLHIHDNSAHLVKWITENNRPANIINDRELRDLLTAGRPNIELPSNNTIFRDIKASFEKCRNRIAKLLQEHPGRLHFATDAWTSPNHRAFVAWTVHLEYEGEMLSFLLDIIELPEVRCRLF